MVTENDYRLQLFNGDTGVVVDAGNERLVAAFERGDDGRQVSPTRLAAVDTVYAMTVHKSQGSQFDTVAFLLPGSDSRVLTRELLYTAVTRAQERLILIGTGRLDQGRGRAVQSPGPQVCKDPSGQRELGNLEELGRARIFVCLCGNRAPNHG